MKHSAKGIKAAANAKAAEMRQWETKQDNDNSSVKIFCMLMAVILVVAVPSGANELFGSISASVVHGKGANSFAPSIGIPPPDRLVCAVGIRSSGCAQKVTLARQAPHASPMMLRASMMMLLCHASCLAGLNRCRESLTCPKARWHPLRRPFCLAIARAMRRLIR